MGVASLAWAGTTGKLSGRIVDDKKQPMPGVNVRIEGQRLGAISDEQGNYFIIGIPGGTYVVHANLIGYAPFVAEKVQITPDFTTELNMTLRARPSRSARYASRPERPLLQKDATGTTPLHQPGGHSEAADPRLP